MNILKVTFEMVDPRWAENWNFYNGEDWVGGPLSEIPDRHWKTVESVQRKPDEESRLELLDQWRGLREWAANENEPIRNVRLFKSPEPVWTELLESDLDS